MEMRDGTDPAVGGYGVVVCVEGAVLVADGLDEAGAGRPVVAPYRFPIPNSRFYWIECCNRSQRIRTAEGSALSADALDDVGKWRIDVVRALALDVVELLDDRARAGVDRKDRIARIDRRVVVGRCLRHHARAGAGFGNYAIDVVVGILYEQTRLALLRLDLSLAVAGCVVGPFGDVCNAVKALDAVRHREAP